MSAPDLDPPWVLFSVDGKPEAILPAGRPGEVASVRGVSLDDAQRIVSIANSQRDDPLGAAIDALAAYGTGLRAYAEGAAQKQATIVAWLRSQEGVFNSAFASVFADGIEQGKHEKEC